VTMGHTKQKEAKEKVFFTTYSDLYLLHTPLMNLMGESQKDCGMYAVEGRQREGVLYYQLSSTLTT